jgi:hypothetical protein
MSWSFYATGKPGPVLAKARKELGEEAYKLAEPEHTIRSKFLHTLEAALLVMPEDSAVRIEASGSQSTHDGSRDYQPGTFNNFRCVIEPIFGFVE